MLFIVKKDGKETANGIFISSTVNSARGKILMVKETSYFPEIESLVFIKGK